MTSEICVHFIVSGQVQGVFYRDSTQRKAAELNVTGWIRNLPNGQVEGIVCGEPEKVDILCEWLWTGPPSADVKNVQKVKVDFKKYKDFQIVR